MALKEIILLIPACFQTRPPEPSVGDFESGFFEKFILDAPGKTEQGDEAMAVPLPEYERHARNRKTKNPGGDDIPRREPDLSLGNANLDPFVFNR